MDVVWLFLGVGLVFSGGVLLGRSTKDSPVSENPTP